MSVDTKELLLNGRPLQPFFSIESQCAPCVSKGTSDFWLSIDNHNRSCERFIGIMKDIVQNRKSRMCYITLQFPMKESEAECTFCLYDIDKYELDNISVYFYVWLIQYQCAMIFINVWKQAGINSWTFNDKTVRLFLFFFRCTVFSLIINAN